MTPQDLGLPAQFDAFRSAQSEAIDFSLTTDRRFVGIGAPPGVGKSLIAVALGRLIGGRTVILTGTKGLQDQYSAAFGSVVTDMRGRSNFHCWEGGTCEDGGRLGCKDKLGCPYLCRLRAWNKSDIAVTNYAYWLSAAQGIEPPDTLICDESGTASEWLSRALDFTIGERECREGKMPLAELPGEDIADWLLLGLKIQAAALTLYERVKMSMGSARGATRERLLKELKRAEGFVDRAAKITILDPANWVCTREEGTDEGRVWRFECVWPGRYREKLFRSVKRVILMSATLRPKTLNLLGIPRAECDFREWPRQFPISNGPVVWVPTARVGHRMNNEDRQRWLGRHHEIFEWGSDRKGLVHTVSFARAREIKESTEASGKNAFRIILNGAADPESNTANAAVEQFRRRDDGEAILVSPSFSTGWDFPGRDGEWQILSKIAFPDTRSKVMTARVEADRGYPNYLAAQELVQGCGRIVRSETDRGMSLILDDHVGWFTGAAAEYIPRWFRIRREEQLPTPLKKI